MTKKKYSTPKGKYRSTFEYNVAASCRKRKLKVKYEPHAIPFTVPAIIRKYTPDFTLPNGIVIECKGRFTVADRKKMLWVRESNPELDIRLVFQNASVKLQKKGKMTYGDWATWKGFTWAEGDIPDEWWD